MSIVTLLLIIVLVLVILGLVPQTSARIGNPGGLVVVLLVIPIVLLLTGHL